MKIYTKTGDDGQTGLYGGGRVRKDAPRIEAYGTVDELNAVLGTVRATSYDSEEPVPAALDDLLARIQNELFDLGAELATIDPAARGVPQMSAEHAARLEAAIDEYETGLAPLRQFILPGGTPAAAGLHVARTVCRRAERRVISLAADPTEGISSHVVIYLNRLSDLLFVLARAANSAAHQPDVPWRKG